MPQPIKPLKIHSRDGLIEAQARKHLKRLRVAIPPNLSAVIKAVSHAGDWLNQPPKLPGGWTAPAGFLSVFRESQTEIKATLAECLHKYPGAFFEVHDFLKRFKASESNLLRVAKFLASHGTIYSYDDGGDRLKYFSGGGSIRITGGQLQFISDRGQPKAGVKIKREKVSKQAHKKLTSIVQGIIGGSVKARTVKDARKILR
jgi:hypothetical protein